MNTLTAFLKREQMNTKVWTSENSNIEASKRRESKVV